MRDIDSDRENGKNTLAVRLGPVNARRYHACLLMGALVCLALFNLISLHSLWGWLFVLAAPLLIKQARFVMRERSPAAMPPQASSRSNIRVSASKIRRVLHALIGGAPSFPATS